MHFTVGGTTTFRNINVEALDTVHFEWHKPGNGCGTLILTDSHKTPSTLPTVWNINWRAPQPLCRISRRPKPEEELSKGSHYARSL
ncbi:hypothetical protein [Streptomyces griseiscabiei]|uniref:Uncharacterized protein n=1 Tax=Streptomyces griseiscabiei TaxID=2993540 RepID=A0ABU4L5T0_9ACTN|nr:hypothetical protein [Streptomyces griseiscabiei]MBZ3905420.1 hypothetical protein [Streptomyces griseiscabiei]MDX2910509.1 hypothetical protein [Streptomyces griseiscabiei]